jgi:ketosteroid isomerase-like protein
MKTPVPGLLAGLWGVALAAGPAQASGDVAQAYLAAYESQDFERLAELYAPDARFVDPTSFDVPETTPPIDWQGPDAIIAGLQSWGVADVDYQVDRSFTASGRTVFDGSVTAVFANNGDAVSYRFPIITIVTVADGHVVEHRDYTDYAGARRVMEGN